jgi:predicted transcriptional regulator of viral defense system
MVNEEYEPTDTEEQVLAVMREEWRANPYLIREETGLGKGTINTALSNLRAAGWIRRVTRGLYEFVDDPRDTDD